MRVRRYASQRMSLYLAVLLRLYAAGRRRRREQSAVEQRVHIAREHRKLSGQVIFGPQATQAA